MKFEYAKLQEELNPKIVESMKMIKDKIKEDPKLREYIDDYEPKGEPYAYVLSKGSRYSLHCHLKWEKVAKRAAEVIKDPEFQTEMETAVADKVGDTVLSKIIGGDYSEYSPKVKRNGVVIEVILSVPKIKNEPANMMAQEQPLEAPEATV
jgi:hypothetical protein